MIMNRVLMLGLVAATSLLACASAKAINVDVRLPVDGEIVLAQWDGRTTPDVQWALDVTRLDTSFHFNEVKKLSLLIPTRQGPVTLPTLTAYDDMSRTFFTTVPVMVPTPNASATLWGTTIADNVSAAVPLFEVKYAFPSSESQLVGIETARVNGALVLFAVFKSGEVVTVDLKTGATTSVAALCDVNAMFVSHAITVDPVKNQMYVILNPNGVASPRQIVTLDLATHHVTNVSLATLKDHNPVLEAPFEIQWLPTLQTTLVFFTGNFDQLVFVDPATGATAFYVDNLAQFEGSSGVFQFTADDSLADDDTWQDSTIDHDKAKIYFQCTDTDTSGDGTTTLCVTAVPTKVGEMCRGVNSAIEPMSYGFAGMHFVSIVA
eukprot:m.46837 g.46837  ORF g.46837 m.46837 type:complete len:378 (-) comp20345_c0_seq2:130-1263(-)